MPSSRPPTENPGQSIHDTPEVDRHQDETLERDTARLRARFEEEMANRTPGNHREVAVLILFWDPHYYKEKVLQVSDEVNQLRDIFENMYGFNVYEGKLSMVPGKAKDSINKHMADFMLEENFEDRLLIIYYAGHGGLAMGTPNGLTLTGAQSLSKVDNGKEIVWDKVEALIEDAKADMLLIFDCCHAARAANRKRRSTFSRRIYEVLAACQADELAPGPGRHSFTSALIWALKQLAQTSKAFTTSQLYHKILSYPDYERKDDEESGHLPNHPYWSEKAGYHTEHRLKITPKFIQDQQEAEPASQPANFQMDFQLLSTEIPSDEDMLNLCKKLKEVLNPDKPSPAFHQVLWRGFAAAHTQKLHFQHYAEIVRLRLKQKRMQNQINRITKGNSGSPEASIFPLLDDDILSSQAILDSQTLARHQSFSTESLPVNGNHNRQLVALQSLARDNLGWLVIGSGLVLIGFLWGRTK